MSRKSNASAFDLESHEQAIQRGYTVFTSPCPWCGATRDQKHTRPTQERSTE